MPKGASQVELQGGYGGGGFIGTIGLTFNNFSLKNIRDPRLGNLFQGEMVKQFL